MGGTFKVVGARLVLADSAFRETIGRAEVEADKEVEAVGLCEVEVERDEEGALEGGPETDDDKPDGTLGFLIGAREGAEAAADGAAPPTFRYRRMIGVIGAVNLSKIDVRRQMAKC